MKNQTLSIEQMKHLKDLGVDTNKASMHWQYIPTADNIMGKDDSEELALFVSGDYKMEHCFPAFTLQDMLEMMPTSICDNSYFLIAAFDELHGTNTRVYTIRYVSVSHKDYCYFEGTSLIEATYQMLCWLAQNGHMKGGKP